MTNLSKKQVEKIVLFYKKLVEPGGAERLLIKEFSALQAMGYDPYVACYDFSEDALFGADIPKNKVLCVGGFWGLVLTLRRLKVPGVLCASGHLDIGLASLLTGSVYGLHIHHPSFMTFNETDKYSVFQRRHFDTYTTSNFGATRFREIVRSFSILDKLKINLRAAISIWAIRRSRCNFVLSSLARQEKRDLFGVEAIVLYGALERESLLQFDNICATRAIRSPKATLKLLTLARLDENKRIDELLQVVAMLKSEGREVTLRIAGRGPEIETLQAMAHKLRLNENEVQFLGFVPDKDLPSLMRWADLFVSIDWADYKLTMYEALSYALPVLVSTETECSDELMATGYVLVSIPERTEVARAIAHWADKSPACDSAQLRGVLETVTWEEYFRRIATELHRHGVLSQQLEGAE